MSFCKHYATLLQTGSEENEDDKESAVDQAAVVQLFYRNPPNWILMERYLSEHPYKHMKTLFSYTLERQAPESIVFKILEKYPHVALDADDDVPLSCLHIACMMSTSTSIVRVVLGANPSLASGKSANLRLPLHHARTTEIAQLLLEAYPSGISEPDLLGYLPLHCACINENCTIELVEYLVQEGIKQGVPKGGVLLPVNNGTLPLGLLKRKFILNSHYTKNKDERCNELVKNTWRKLTFIAKQHLLSKREGNRQMGLSQRILSSFRSMIPSSSLPNDTDDFKWKIQYMSTLHTLLILEFPLEIISYAINSQPDSLATKWSGRNPLNLVTAEILPKNPKYAYDVIIIMLRQYSSSKIDSTMMPAHEISMRNFVLEGAQCNKQSLFYTLDNFSAENEEKNVYCCKIVDMLIQYDRRLLDISEYTTKLYPFMYASSSTYYNELTHSVEEKFPASLTLIYQLLRQAPWIIRSLT